MACNLAGSTIGLSCQLIKIISQDAVRLDGLDDKRSALVTQQRSAISADLGQCSSCASEQLRSEPFTRALARVVDLDKAGSFPV